MANDFIDISLIGDKKLQKKLAKLELSMQRRLLKRAMSRAMLPVRDRARTLVPIDRGRLKSSIKRLPARTKRGITRVRVVPGTRAELGISPDERYYYPAAIEYGTRNRPARSFLRRAMTDLKSQTLRLTGTYLDRLIRQQL